MTASMSLTGSSMALHPELSQLQAEPVAGDYTNALRLGSASLPFAIGTFTCFDVILFATLSSFNPHNT